MLILFTILVVLSAVIVIPFFIKTRKSHSSENPRQLEPPPFRGLFAPNEEEIRASEREEQARLKARKDEEAQQTALQKQEKIREFHTFWQSSPNKKNTVDLILLAAESDSGKIFAEIAESVIKLWQAKKIEDVSGDDLALVLESHFWLLPNEERTSGVSFWLKQEIAGLRTNQAGKN